MVSIYESYILEEYSLKKKSVIYVAFFFRKTNCKSWSMRSNGKFRYDS